jgi:beta-galactosidase
MSRLRLGSAWYPEHSEDAVWREDLARMRELGFDTVRVGDFAWARLEPTDGVFDLAWLRSALDLAHAHGIGVVLCTPTAGPPAWMLHAHPDIGWVERDGYRHGVGGRQAGDYCHPLFQEYCRRITTVLAEAFGTHPAVIGWQIDNELGGHQKVSLSPAALAAWHVWLAERYGTVERLNAVWGTQVWSNRYLDFTMVPGPHPLPNYCHHHSLHTAYRRFMNDAAIAFQRQQVVIIRAASTAPISHNSEDSLDEWLLTRDLDIAGHDCYTRFMPLPAIVMRMDCFRCLKPGRRFWVLETDADGDLADGPFPAGWTANFAAFSYASGAELVSYWPWRTNRSGAEMVGHDGLLHACGTPTTGWAPAQRTAVLRTALEPLLARFHPAPAEIAFIRSEYHGHFHYIERIAGLQPNFDFRARLGAHHADLVALGAWRDVRFDQDDLSGYRVVVSPYLPTTTPDFLKRMQAHLAGGGVWIVGPYTGYLTDEHTNPLNGLLGDLGELLALDVRAWRAIPTLAVVLADGTRTTALMHAHGFAPAAADDVLGTYDADPLRGLAWGLRKRVGGGTVYVLGSELEPDARMALYRSILQREGVLLHPMPPGVLCVPQVDAQGVAAWVLLNTGRVPQRVGLPTAGRDWLTGADLEGHCDLAAGGQAFVDFHPE